MQNQFKKEREEDREQFLALKNLYEEQVNSLFFFFFLIC